MVRLVDKMGVSCEFLGNGCPESMRIEILDAHERQCGFRMVACVHETNGCLEEMLRQDRDDHVESCGYAKTNCPRCKDSLLRKDYDEHLAQLLCIQALMVRMAEQAAEHDRKLAEQAAEHDRQLAEQAADHKALQKDHEDLKKDQKKQHKALKEDIAVLKADHAVMKADHAAPEQIQIPKGAVLTVVGAGDDSVNGYYKVNGESRGKPRYLKVSGFHGVACIVINTLPHAGWNQINSDGVEADPNREICKHCLCVVVRCDALKYRVMHCVACGLLRACAHKACLCGGMQP